MTHDHGIHTQKRQFLEQACHVGQRASQGLAGGLATLPARAIKSFLVAEGSQALDERLGTGPIGIIAARITGVIGFERAEILASPVLANVGFEPVGIVAPRAATNAHLRFAAPIVVAVIVALSDVALAGLVVVSFAVVRSIVLGGAR